MSRYQRTLLHAATSVLCFLLVARLPARAQEPAAPAPAEAPTVSNPDESGADSDYDSYEPEDEGEATTYTNQTPVPTPDTRPTPTPPGPFVPPNKEELLSQMFGLGETLPGECKFSEGKGGGEVVQATYKCASGSLSVDLRHPGKMPGAVAKSDKFEIFVAAGSPPAGFVDALVTRIRAREKAFEWALAAPKTPAASSSQPAGGAAGLPTSPLAIAGIVVAVVVVGFGLQRLLRR